jgi:hypothetical protein
MEARRRKQAFDKSVPVFAAWVKRQHEIVKKDLGVWTSFGRWLAVPDANHKDQAIQAACERHSVNYPIQGGSADILKIVLVLLHKEFHKRGWLKNGGDDSVRMLLTVHDEIVFEIRHDRVTEAIPVIIRIMESPAQRAKPPWKVPMIVEPLIGVNWGSGYPCERVKEGHTPSKDEVVVNGFAYSVVRKAKKDTDKAGDGEVSEGEGKKRKIRILNPPWLKDVANQPPPASDQVPKVVEPKAAPPTPPSEPKGAPTPVAKKSGIVTVKIRTLNHNTVRGVLGACARCADPDGRVLRLTDIAGKVLIEPTMGIRIDPELFCGELFDLNLSDGGFVEEAN